MTIHDVARHTGVSAASISRVLNGHPHVSAALRRRVEAAVRELAYAPNPAAHSLRSGATGLVGFLLDTMANGPIYAAVEASLRTKAYSMLLTNTQNDPALGAAYLQLMARRRVDGLLIDSGIAGRGQLLESLIRLHIPAVIFDHDAVPDATHLGVIQNDHASGMRAAVAHLAEQGHQRIALLCGPDSWWPARERRRAFLDGLAAVGLAPEPRFVRSIEMSAALAYGEASALLAEPQPPTALIAGGNVLLLGVLRACQALGVVPGRDLALVGADDLDITQLYSPPITVIARDLNLLGEMAVHLLTETIRGDGGRAIALPTRLLVRESSSSGPTVRAR